MKAQANNEKNAKEKRELFLRARTCFNDTLQLRREILADGENAQAYRNIAIVEHRLGLLNADSINDWDQARRDFAASMDAYSGALRLSSSDQDRQDTENSYVYAALVDVYRGKDRLAHGNNSEAQEAFQSARAATERSLAKFDGRRVRATIEHTIGESWRDTGKLAKDPAYRQKCFRYALESDQIAVRIWKEVAANKQAVEQYLGEVEKDTGLDYAYLDDIENAKRYFEASAKTYLGPKPSAANMRIVAANYAELAEIESQRDNYRAARWAFDNEIELLRPLVQNSQATADDKERLGLAFGIRSWMNSLLGDPWAALVDAEQGLLLDKNKIATRVNRADAYLLLGQVEKARTLYLELAADTECPTCKKEILNDLSEIQSRPELKVDPKVLASLTDELKTVPQQRTATQSPGGKP